MVMTARHNSKVKECRVYAVRRVSRTCHPLVGGECASRDPTPGLFEKATAETRMLVAISCLTTVSPHGQRGLRCMTPNVTEMQAAHDSSISSHFSLLCGLRVRPDLRGANECINCLQDLSDMTVMIGSESKDLSSTVIRSIVLQRGFAEKDRAC